MKIRPVFLIFILMISSGILVNAQHFTKADDYLNFIGKQHKEIAENITDYTSELVKGKGKEAEPERKKILEQIKTANLRIRSLHPFKVDKSFQDSAMVYLNTNSKILKNEVPKVLAMEDSLGKSLEATKRFLNKKEAIVQGLSNAEENLNKYGKTFVAKYKLKEEYNDDDVFERLKNINNANSYFRSIYLLHLKAMEQEAALIKGMTKKDTIEMKDANAKLSQTVKEGMAQLDSLGSFNNDNSLMMAEKLTLQFYQVETEFKVPMLISLLQKEDAYVKLKKEMAGKKESEKTQEEKDQLASATADHNEHLTTYSNTISDLNNERPKVWEGWNNAVQVFLEKNVK